MSEETPVVETIQVRLERVARAINNRFGEFPDADLIREAIQHINSLEEAAKSAPAKPATTGKEKA